MRPLSVKPLKADLSTENPIGVDKSLITSTQAGASRPHVCPFCKAFTLCSRGRFYAICYTLKKSGCFGSPIFYIWGAAQIAFGRFHLNTVARMRTAIVAIMPSAYAITLFMPILISSAYPSAPTMAATAYTRFFSTNGIS